MKNLAQYINESFQVNESKVGKDIIKNHLDDELDSKGYFLEFDNKPQLRSRAKDDQDSYVLAYELMKGSSRSAEIKKYLAKLGIKPIAIEMQRSDNEHIYYIELER